jgi:DNA-binding beta-propeller fold protein YncE
MNTGVVTFPSDRIRNLFWTFDPKESWAFRLRYMKFKESTIPLPGDAWKKSTASCAYDGYFYTHYQNGHLVKIDPKTYETEIIYMTPSRGDCYGMAFHPKQPKMLYMAFWSDAGSVANSICSLDITDPAGTFTKLSGAINGSHRDGELSVAQFNKPCQIFFDSDGNLYIADSGNHCIRKLNTETNMVETVVGIPRVTGDTDGGKDEARFNEPRGIAVAPDGTVYVGDHGNARIRKLAIE